MKRLIIILILLLAGCKGAMKGEDKSYFDKDHSPYLGSPKMFLSSIVNSTFNTVTLRWDDSAGADYYIVKYKPSTSPTWIEATLNTQSPYSVTGLSNNTSYDFLVTSKNPRGQMDSNIVTMSTLASSASPRIATVVWPSFNEGVEEIITLPYTQPGVDMANACEAVDLQHVSITRSCQCDSFGVCTIGITGEPQFGGTGSFRYRIMIGPHASDYEMVWFTLNAVNDAPTISTFNNLVMSEDTPQTFNFTINDPDSSLQCTSSFLTATTSNTSLITLSNITFCGTYPDCTVRFNPLYNTSGTSNVTISVSDGFLTTPSNSFSVTVNAVNDAPTLSPLIAASTLEDTVKTINFTIGDVDSTVTCSSSVSATSSNSGLVNPANIVITGSGTTCTATITPTLYQNGTTQITLNVSDGDIQTQGTFTLTVAAVNNAPVISMLTNTSTNEDQVKVVNFTLNDVDSTIACSSSYLSAASSNSLVVLSTDITFGGMAPNCTASISPLSNKFGSTNITFTATDGVTSTTSNAFTLAVNSVNDRPTISNILAQTTLQDTAKVIHFTIDDIDTTLTCASVTAVSSDTTIVANAGVVITAGTFPDCIATITPVTGKSGTASITLTVTDGSLTNTSVFPISITAVNVMPTLTNITAPVITEDGSGAITFTLNDPDSTLACSSSYVIVTSSNTALLPLANIVLSGTYPNCTATATPAANQSGTTSVSLAVTDGVVTSTATTFSITVNAVNDGPTISTITSQTLSQDTAKVVNFTVGDVDSLVTCSDVTATSSNTNILLNSGIAISGTGTNCTATITPISSKNGSLTVTLAVNDGYITSSSIFAVNIVAVNAAPTISTLLNTTINEDGTATVNFTLDDQDSTVACTASYLSAASSNVALVPTTDIVFSGTYPSCIATIKPLANQYGFTNITFIATDGSASRNSNAFRLDVTAVNDAPNITPILAQAINQDSSAAISFTITDVDSTLTCGSVTKSSSLTSVVANGNVVVSGTAPDCTAVITPIAGKSGLVDITFTISDGSLSKSSVFSLAINAVNAAPTIAAISDTTINEDVPSSISFVINDPDSPSIACTSSYLRATSTNASLVDPNSITFSGTYPNCSANFTPGLHQYGTTTLALIVSDGVLSTTSNDVVLTVNAIDDAPIMSSIATQNWGPNQSSTVNITVTDVDSTVNCLTTLTAASSDHTVIVPTSIVFSGSAPNCVATITPVPSQIGPVTVTLTATSGSASSSTSFVMTFGASTVPPVATNITPAIFNEDTQSIITLAYDSHVAHATSCYVSSLTHVTVSTPCSCTGAGVCTVGVKGTTDYNGSASFSYMVTANSFSSNAATASLTILPVNDAPLINTILAQSTAEDTAKVISFTVSDTDSTLNCATSVSLTSSDTALVDPANVTFGGSVPNCQVTINPTANKNGSSAITLTVSDGSLTAQSAFNLTVTAVNDAPTMLAIANDSTNEDVSKIVNLTIGDVDSTVTCSGSVIASSTNTALVATSDIVFGGTYPSCTATITPKANSNGATNLTFSVSDSSLSSSQTFTFNVTAVNDAPVISTIAAQSTPEYIAKAVNFTISDVDTTLICSTSVTATSSNTALVPHSSVVITGTAPNCVATVSPLLYQNGLTNITLVVNDGITTSQSLFALTVTAVNHAPTMAAISNQATNEDTAKIVAFTLNDVDSSITCTTSVTATTSTNTGLVILSKIAFGGTYPNCTASITPESNISGTTDLTFSVTDGALSDSKTFTLAVNAVNDAPEVSTIAAQSTPEHTDKVVNFTISDIDNTLTCTGNVTGSSSNTALIPNSGVVISGASTSCTATISPLLYQNGLSNITISVNDGSLTTQRTFALTVTPVNDAPTISTIAAQSMNEDATKVLNFTINDVDSSITCSGAMSATSTNNAIVGPSNVVFSGTYPNCTASIHPHANANGSVDLTFVVNDGSLTGSQTFTLAISALDDAPEISIIAAQSTLESTPKNVAFTISDVDSSVACNTSVSASSTNTSLVPNANISIAGSATSCVATITPVQYQNGSTSITFSVTADGKTSQSAFVLNVASVNNAPHVDFIANISTNEDVVKVVDFVVGDVDSTIACNSSYISAVSSNTSLLLSTDIVFSGTFPNCKATLTSLPNMYGDTNITFTITDGTDSSNSNAFQLSVISVNDAPIISTIMAQSTDEDTIKTVNFTIADVDSSLVCANHVTGTSSDVSILANNAIVISGTGTSCTATITPVANKNGVVTINLTATDGSLSSSTSFVFTVNAINDAPTMTVIAAQSTNEDTGIVVPVVIDDADGPLACNVRVTGSSANIAIVANANIVVAGTYPNCTATITPTANQHGVVNITMTVSDGALNAARTFALTILSVDDVPVATNISSVTISEDLQSIITLPYTDADNDLATACTISNLNNVSVSSACACSAGTCTVGITGASNYNGAAGFSFSVTANSATSNTATASFSITAVNDAPTIATSPATTNEDTQIAVPFTIGDVDSTLTCAGRATAASSDTLIVPVSSITIGGTYPSCTATILPATNKNGVVTITLTVTDGALSTSSAFALTVTAVDDAPFANNITSATISEDVQTTITLPYLDVDNDLATACTITNLNNITVTSACTCTSGACSVGVTGTPNYNGSAGFSFSVTANGVASNTATASFTILAVNDAPTMVTISTQTTNEDTAIVIPVTIADVDSTLTCAGSVTAASADTSKVITSGIVISGTAPSCIATITPVANANGSVNITLTVSDGTLSTPRLFALNITPVLDISGTFTSSGIADAVHGRTLSFTGITIDEVVSKVEVCISEDTDLSNTISGAEKCNPVNWVDITSAIGATGTSSTSGWTNYTITKGINGAIFAQTLAPTCSTTRRYFTNMKITNSSSVTTEMTSASFTFWNPSCLGNMLGIWLDAKDNDTMFTNSACTAKISGSPATVNCWADKSNYAFKFNGTGTSAPTYNSAAWNGNRPSMVFNGSNDLKVLAANLKPKNVFAAINVTANTPYEGFFGPVNIDQGIRVGSLGGYWVSNVLNIGGDFVYSGILGTAGQSYVNGSVSTTFTQSSEHLFYQSKGTGSLDNWVDVGLGGYISGTGRRIHANISEVFVCVADCSSYQERFEGYMAHKWGLTTNLPPGHPYKNAPPP